MPLEEDPEGVTAVGLGEELLVPEHLEIDQAVGEQGEEPAEQEAQQDHAHALTNEFHGKWVQGCRSGRGPPCAEGTSCARASGASGRPVTMAGSTGSAIGSGRTMRASSPGMPRSRRISRMRASPGGRGQGLVIDHQLPVDPAEFVDLALSPADLGVDAGLPRF